MVYLEESSQLGHETIEEWSRDAAHQPVRRQDDKAGVGKVYQSHHYEIVRLVSRYCWCGEGTPFTAIGQGTAITVVSVSDVERLFA